MATNKCGGRGSQGGVHVGTVSDHFCIRISDAGILFPFICVNALDWVFAGLSSHLNSVGEC